MKVIFIVRLLGLMSEMKSMHGMTRELNTKESIKNIAQICNLELEEIPHCDTINDVFEKIKVEEIEEIRKYMINKLIRGKIIQKYKIRDKYYHIVVDGTGLATSRKKYNENCLVKNKMDKNGNEYQEYSTYVLEAKLIVGEMVFSIGSEFVENTEKNESKQDCEIRAFKRLAEKINVIKYTDVKKNTEFVYITDLPVRNQNIEETINVGRNRWKIENKGFNIQKNGMFDIGHLYSKNQTAIKVHYLLIQIAHMLRQMLENGIKEIKDLHLKIKEVSQKIKEELTSTITNLTVHKKIQLRFE